MVVQAVCAGSGLDRHRTPVSVPFVEKERPILGRQQPEPSRPNLGPAGRLNTVAGRHLPIPTLGTLHRRMARGSSRRGFHKCPRNPSGWPISHRLVLADRQLGRRRFR